MQIYSTATPSVSIVHATWFLSDTDINSYPLNDVIRTINGGYEELIGMIINADGTWQFDDKNYTNVNYGLGTLVEGQELYSFASDYLQIEAIDILNTDGIYRRIKPLDHKELRGMSPQEYYGVKTNGDPNTGFPETFDQFGNSLILYYAPTSTSVTLTNGIKVWFKRTADLFTTADTSQEPGLPSTHHMMLAYMAAIPYCMKFHPNRVPLYEKKVDDMKKTLIAHYGQREKAKREVITPKKTSFR